MSEQGQVTNPNLNIELLNVGTLSEITSFLDMQRVIDDTTIAGLRSDYPNMRFTLCYDTEMGSRDAYSEHDGYEIHLVSHSAVGCSGLTDRLDNCSGLVIAVSDD